MNTLSTFVVAITLVALCGVAASQKDEVFNLPGLSASLASKYAGRIFAGRLPTGFGSDRELFYYYVKAEADNAEASARTILWQNGGPGCSSLDGAFNELGPLIPLKNGTLFENEYSWVNTANVLFIESPAAVGFSTVGKPSELTVGDARTADDIHQFLKVFSTIHPEITTNELLLSGESYGGHYVPTLAARIVKGNRENDLKMNFKGFAVGNAWTYPQYDNYGAVQFWDTHALMPHMLRAEIENKCDFNNVGPLKAAQFDPKECDALVDRAMRVFASRLNIYDTYGDVCLESGKFSNPQGVSLARNLRAAREAGEFVPSPLAHLPLPEEMESVRHATLDVSRPPAGHPNYWGGLNDPCAGDYMATYLNRDDVQDALNVSPRMKWEQCNETTLKYSRADLLTPLTEIYEYLMDSDIVMVVFSGDVDAIVPITGTRLWLPEIVGEESEENFSAWDDVNGQVGGFYTTYARNTTERVHLFTVRGAGHMCPQTQPSRSLTMINKIWNLEK